MKVGAIHYTREELEGIVATRRANRLPEAQGVDAYLEFRVRVTPEALSHMLRSEIHTPEGRVVRMVGVFIDEKGLAEPVLESVEP